MADVNVDSLIGAKLLSKRINDALDDQVSNYSALYWQRVFSASGNSTVVHGRKNVTKEAIIDSVTGDTAYNWTPTRHGSNPLVGSTTAANQAYPPKVIWDGSQYCMVVKTDGIIKGYTSADGISWSGVGTVVPLGANGQWDDFYIDSAVLYFESGTYYIYYSARGANTPIDYKVGLTTNTTFDTNFVKNGGNPLVNITAYNNNTGFSYIGVELQDLVKVGSTYYFFGSMNKDDAYTETSLAYGTSSSLTSPAIDTQINKHTEVLFDSGIIHSPSVFKTAWGWIMTATIGSMLNEKGASATIAAYTTNANPINWTWRLNPVIQPLLTNTFEERETYSAGFLKDGDGTLRTVSSKYRLYYSAHSLNANSYFGVTCLAEYDSIPDLR